MFVPNLITRMLHIYLSVQQSVLLAERQEIEIEIEIENLRGAEEDEILLRGGGMERDAIGAAATEEAPKHRKPPHTHSLSLSLYFFLYLYLCFSELKRCDSDWTIGEFGDRTGEANRLIVAGPVRFGSVRSGPYQPPPRAMTCSELLNEI